jgi:hypothetical protein
VNDPRSPMSDEQIERACWIVFAVALVAIAIGAQRALGAEIGFRVLDFGIPAMAVPELSPTGVPENVTQILVGYFETAQASMREMVLNPTGRTEGAQAFRLARAASQGTQIDAILTRLKKQTANWIGSDQTFLAAVHGGRETADRQAREAGVRVEDGVSGSFDLVDERTASVFARDAAADLYGAADSMAGRSKRLLRATAQQGLKESDINRILAGGTIAGQPVETIRKLRDELKAVHGDTVEINGRNYKVRDYAALVARTKTREAVQVARHERLESVGIDLVAIVGRQSNTFCTAFLGQVFSIGGKSSKYPSLSSLPGGGPPFHPNCSKSTRPFVEALAGDQQKKDARILPDAKTLIGMDPTQAQRAYKDMQLRAQIKGRYADTEAKLFGRDSKAG